MQTAAPTDSGHKAETCFKFVSTPSCFEAELRGIPSRLRCRSNIPVHFTSDLSLVLKAMRAELPAKRFGAALVMRSVGHTIDLPDFAEAPNIHDE
jgi:hypothetical protein